MPAKKAKASVGAKKGAKRAKARKRAPRKVAQKKVAYKRASALPKTDYVSIHGHSAQIRIGRTVTVGTADQIYDTLDISKETIQAARRAVR